jgi:CelD/BcsL family acetyltransferase involved in cellulose biosynthesis
LVTSVFILRDTEAMTLVEDLLFRDQWQILYHQCPWATVFQSFPYIITFYKTHLSKYEPLIVLGRGPCDDLTGLLCLALERRSGRLVMAGKPHTEYTVWLARPGINDLFVEKALDCLRGEFPQGRLDFCYLPLSTPLGWLDTSREWGRFCVLQPVSRPLMAVGDESKIRESLRKKSNRSRIKRLEKLGNLEFQRVRHLDELAGDLDEIIDFYDFRQGAMHKVMPFRHDPLMRPFFTTLLEIPDLLHTTVWRLNGKVISAHIGFRSHDQVSLGIIAYSPFLAEHSPGKMHLFLLGLQLSEEGIRELDLTPGGDSYKDRFATHHDEVHRLTVYFSNTERLKDQAKGAAHRAAKTMMHSFSISPDYARKLVDKLKSNFMKLSNINFIIKFFNAGQKRPLAVFRREATSMGDGPPDSPMIRRDILGDLLVYQPVEIDHPPRANFLQSALMRFEHGDHVYTCVENGLLIYSVWLSRVTETADRDHEELTIRLPSSSVLIDGFFTHPGYLDRGLFQASVALILKDIALSGNTSSIFMIAPPNDSSSRQVLEELGFRDESALPVRTDRTSATLSLTFDLGKQSQ